MNTDAPRPIRPADPGSRGRRGDALGRVLGHPRDPRGRATRPRGGRVRRPVPAKTWPETSSVCIRVYPWNIFRVPRVAAFEWAASSGFHGLLVWRSQADNQEIGIGQRVWHKPVFCLSSASLCPPPHLRVELFVSGSRPASPVDPNHSQTRAEKGLSRNFADPFLTQNPAIPRRRWRSGCAHRSAGRPGTCPGC